jgi:hypothetical protein
MNPYPWTDAQGRAWHLYDWRTVEGRKCGLPMGDRRAESRAFVPANGGVVLVYHFGPVSYHEPLTDRLVQDQLRFAKPMGASAGERMDRTAE